MEVRDAAHLAALQQSGLVGLRFVDNRGNVTVQYPANPNGSPDGITAVTSADGRATIMMPHPERVFRTVANSWHPDNWGEDGAWMRMFRKRSGSPGLSASKETKTGPSGRFFGHGSENGGAGGGEHDGGKAIFSSLLGELLAGGYGMD